MASRTERAAPEKELQTFERIMSIREDIPRE